MIEKSMSIVNKAGMHAKPASQFVKLVSEFKADIEIIKGDRTANAKSIVNILNLGIDNEDEITIRVSGDDEEKILDTIVDFLTNLQ